ncbi:TolC family protein [Pendulispora albinea]|uniref:TolC family protein n=1 Tax=Pendulispora albinea TaxID=2741071 RepID=A0ABZ2LK04_9BACT
MMPRSSFFSVAVVSALVATSAFTAHAQDAYELTLPAALVMARTRAAEMRAARARHETASAEADAALAGYLPSLSGQAGAGQTWSRTEGKTLDESGNTVDYVDNGTRRQLDASASLRWTAFDFWQTPSRVGAARADARAAFQRVRATANDTTRAVASAYFTVVFDQLLDENAKLTTQIRERHAAITHGLVASGIRPTVEEARARVELDLARLESITTERQMAQDKVKLATILLLPPTTPIKVVRPAVLPKATEEPKLAANEAAERRPEVRAAYESVEARERALTAAKVERLPTIGASLDATHRSTLADREDPRYPKENALAAMLTVSVPVFDWRVWGQVPVASGNLAAAEAERAGTVARVRGEAAEAAYGLQSARLALEQSRSTRDLAGATLAVMEARYQAGLVTTTDLFDAAARDADARRGLIRAELGVAQAVIQELAATGRITELER